MFDLMLLLLFLNPHFGLLNNRHILIIYIQLIFYLFLNLFEKEYNELTEDEKRLYQRNLTRKGNYSLNIAAKNAGVKNFDKFHNSGYKGLYNGETANDIAKRKNLRYREDILDNMNEDELVANLFRINQTKQRLIRDNVQGEKEAKDVHYEVGKKVRKAIADIGGMILKKCRHLKRV